MAAGMGGAKATCEGIICQVDKDDADRPSFFVYIKTNECSTTKKLIQEALQNSASALVPVEESAIETGTVMVVSVGEKLLRCCFLSASDDTLEVYLLDEGSRALVKQDKLFSCPESLKIFKIFCCIRPVLVDDVPPPQVEVARALIGFKCRFIGDEMNLCNGKPYAKGMVLVEYENGSYSDIKDIGTKPIEGRQCPHFRVEVKKETVNNEYDGESRNGIPDGKAINLVPVASSSGVEETGNVLQKKVAQNRMAPCAAIIASEARELKNVTEQLPEVDQNSKVGRNAPKIYARKQSGYSEKYLREMLKLDSPNTTCSSGAVYDEEKVDYNRNCFKEMEKNYRETSFPVDGSFKQSSRMSFKDCAAGRRTNEESSSFYRGKWVDFPERRARPLSGQRRRGSYFKSYYENVGNFEEPYLKQKTFREFEPSSYPCKMRMRFGRKEPGLRVSTFWIIDTVTFTNVERVLHEGRVRYKQTPGFGSSRVDELVGTGCLASVFMDDMYTLARAIITNFCEETFSFSVYLVDYGFYKTTKLKDLIDISHINKGDPILTLPLSMLRCQLESSSPLKLMDLQRGSEYEFEILRRKTSGIYVVNAGHLSNDDPVLSSSSASKDIEFSSSGNTNSPHQVVPEYESIVKMLESKIDLLGSNMVGNGNHDGWLSGSGIYNNPNPNPNMVAGMCYNSSPYPFIYWVNNFGYAMPMFMPMVMPLAQHTVGENNKGVKDSLDSQSKELQRNSRSASVQEDLGEDLDGLYNESGRRQGSEPHGFLRSPAFRSGVRRNVDQCEHRAFHKSQGHDFARGRRNQEFKRDFGRQRKYDQPVCAKNAFSFGGKESGGERRSCFEFFSPKCKNSLVNRRRSTASNFLENASSEWDVLPPDAAADEEDGERVAETRKHSAPVEFF